MKMPKKTVKKTAKPLASALTVANPVGYKPGLLPELPKPTMAAQGIPSPSESTTPPKLTSTSAGVPPKLPTPLAPMPLPPIIGPGWAKQSVASVVEAPKSPIVLPPEPLTTKVEPAKPIPQLPPAQWYETPAVAEKAPIPTATPSVKVNFVLLEPNAKQVSLCGDFNGWVSHSTPMKRNDGGHWETTVALAPGRYEYKFWVDGHWIFDPLAHANVWNRHGTLNSVVEVRA